MSNESDDHGNLPSCKHKKIITELSSIADPDPHGSGTFAWIQIQQKVKEQINKTVNSGLFVL